MMKLKNPLFILLVSFALAVPGSVLADEPSQTLEKDAPTALCLPGVYTTSPADCQPLGPSTYLTEKAAENITFPLQPLPLRSPDASLSELPFYYARVSSKAVPLYSTAEDAAADGAPRRYIELGLNYVTWEDWRQINGKNYYMLQPGEWVKGSDVSINIVASKFSGQEFLGTPEHKFGWILFTVESQDKPGLSGFKFTGIQYKRFDIVQVYDTREVDGVTWNLIGPDQWVEKRYTALVYPAAEPPEGVENGRWIEINLYEQTVSVYQDNRLVYATLTSTGLSGWWTRPGLFQIYEKEQSTLMTGSFEADRSDYYYLEDVPWTMYFDESRAFHGAYWHNKFGFEQSHGCANLSPADSRWLFDWASLGDWVYVWDPSGKTPTDPSLYGSGGA